jgi:phosphoglycerate kinase
MELPRLADLPALDGRRVLVRVDFNVPLGEGPEGAVVEDDLRIASALPTLRWLQDHGAAVVACSHLGRPKGAPDPRYSMEPVATRLRELLGTPVTLAPAVVGDRVQAAAAALGPGEVLLLQNLRFEPGETKNDPAFADALSALGDAYVNDAFGASHRAHASIVGPPARLPSAAGFLLEREVDVLSGRLGDARRALRRDPRRRRDGVHVPGRAGLRRR